MAPPTNLFKKAGKLNAEHKGRENQVKTRMSLAGKTLGDRKKFPPEVKTVNMIHVMKRRSKNALQDVCVVDPVTPSSPPGRPARSLLITGITRLVSGTEDRLPWY